MVARTAGACTDMGVWAVVFLVGKEELTNVFGFIVVEVLFTIAAGAVAAAVVVVVAAAVALYRSK